MGRKVHDEKIKETKVKEKRRLKEPKFLKICPKCGSIKVKVSKAGLQPGLPSQYKCAKCGYSSYFFKEITKEQLKKRSKLRYRLKKFSSRNIKRKRK